MLDSHLRKKRISIVLATKLEGYFVSSASITLTNVEIGILTWEVPLTNLKMCRFGMVGGWQAARKIKQDISTELCYMAA